MKHNLHSRLFTFLAASLLFVLTACPRGGKTDPTPDTNTGKITRGWKVQQVDAATNGATTTLYQEGASGNAENYAAYRLNFISDSNFRRTEKDGTTNTDGGWSFNGDETQITFDRGNPPTIRIVSLSDNSLVYSYSETNAKNVTRELTFRMVPL